MKNVPITRLADTLSTTALMVGGLLLATGCANPSGNAYVPYFDYDTGADGAGDDAADSVVDATLTQSDVVAEDAGAAGDAPAVDATGCSGPTCCESVAACDDGDPCTDDGCAAATCTHTPLVGCSGVHAPCLNTAGCKTGVCDPTSNACVACVVSKDCGAAARCKAGFCVAAKACTSDLHCKASGQVCAMNDGACVDCNVDADCGKDTGCVAHSCKVKTPCASSKQCVKVCDTTAGVCVDCDVHADCGAGDMCDNASHTCVPSICSGGACAGSFHYTCKADGTGYEAGKSCDDGNTCTDDGCTSSAGCAHQQSTKPCDDSDLCTVGDACKSGGCVSGVAKECDDSNPCTSDSCAPAKGCVFTPHNEACDDGNSCTLGEACDGGGCAGGTAKSCDDGVICTDDSCVPASGCAHANTSKACDDGDKCTGGDICKGGTCAAGGAKDCDDKNPCTADACAKTSGKCTHVAKAGACDDGDSCTESDACAGGVCKGGKAKSCADGLVCTADTCDSKTGCHHPPASDGIVCAGGTCKAGSCAVTPPAVGSDFTCVLKGNAVRCFGENQYGKLGGGSSSLAVTVADVKSLGAAAQVTAGGDHACARLTDGTVRCWGSNVYGQLGTGSTVSSLNPAKVVGLSGVAGVTAGITTTCAWRTDGSAVCWGQGDAGQRGDGSTAYKKSTPQKVLLSEKVTSMSMGLVHGCAITTLGHLWCWGSNIYLAIADSAENGYVKPVQIKGLPPMTEVATGDHHTCALSKTGAVWCWGRNHNHQATGLTTYLSKVAKPVPVAGVVGAIAIAAYASTSCALLKTGKVRCWGRNYSGQAGTGNNAYAVGTTEVKGLSGATTISLGAHHACAFAKEKLRCWGSNKAHQLGLTTVVGPKQVVGLTTATAVVLGFDHSCALLKSGAAMCWGAGGFGQLGDKPDASGANYDSSRPVKVATNSVYQAIRTSESHSCGLIKGGAAECWGSASFGALGTGTTSGTLPPSKMTALSSVDDLQLGKGFTCALSQGKTYCWGRNDSGQVGDGTTKSQTKPVAIAALAGAKAVAVGRDHACAIAKDGALWCWGDNSYGQLGVGTKTSSSAPLHVKGLTNITAVTAGNRDTCARDKAGKVFCWGDNTYTQVGKALANGNAPYSSPLAMTAYPAPVSSMAIDSDQFCAVVSGGSLRCQGRALDGALLGCNTIASSATPLVSTLTGVLHVATGGNFTCGLKNDGTVWCDGRNDIGQLGDHSAWRFVPSLVEVY